MNAKFAALALVIALAGCAAPVRRAPPPGASALSPAQLLAVVQSDAARSDLEPAARESLASDAERAAQNCLAQAAGSALCEYADAVALGLGARAHPARAGALLTQMLAALERADALDATLDQAGPARVRALVLARAPGWPLGPGDPEAAVIAARRAVELRPDYPPNLLALAEALTKSGDRDAARENYQRALSAAEAAPAGAERETWMREAERGLR